MRSIAHRRAPTNIFSVWSVNAEPPESSHCRRRTKCAHGACGIDLRLGIPTETARDGMEGWEKALAWNPAIVVTDLKMPRMDGIGLLTKLAEDSGGLTAILPWWFSQPWVRSSRLWMR